MPTCSRAEKPQDLDLLEVFCRLGEDLGLLRRDLETAVRRYSTEGSSFLTRTLPLLGKALDRGLAVGFFELPTNFKKCSRKSEIPAFCGSFFRKIFRPDGFLLEQPCVISVYVIRQISYFLYKAELDFRPQDVVDVMQRFVSVDNEIKTINDRGFQNHPNSSIPLGTEKLIVDVASKIISEVFSDFDPKNIRPNNGPGVVSNCSFFEKLDKKLEPNLPVYEDYGDTFWFNPEDGLSRLHRYPISSHFDFFRVRAHTKKICVPKDSRGPRLISCEPQEHQWVQQGIMTYMVERLEQHPLTRGQCNFTDQSVNQQMARLASMTKKWATLDLKDASDRTSLRLLKDLFGGSQLYRALLLTRSSRTDCEDGKTMKLAKFAPMGSALCFPVMATCIYMLLAARLLTLGEDWEFALGSVFVYGDDIIVPSEYADECINTLQHFGYLVNRDKSFISSDFAESCGHDYYRGNLVSPIRIKKCRNVKEPSTIVSLVKKAHLLTKAGCFKTAEFLYSTVEKYLGRLPWGSLSSPYLCRLALSSANIPEMNILTKQLKWKKEADTIRYPLGASLKGWTIKSTERFCFETPQAHMMRTFPRLGLKDPDQEVPFIGVFEKPRSPRLARGVFDHYSME